MTLLAKELGCSSARPNSNMKIPFQDKKHEIPIEESELISRIWDIYFPFS